MKNALIFYGGWDGHTPKQTASVFEKMLKEEGYNVTTSDNLSVLDAYEDIADIDLFVPVWTMGSITREQSDNISKAVSNGAGMAGCHGGMCDTFRDDTTWQFMTGAQWVAHPGNNDVVYKVNLKHDNPFTDGLSDFEYCGEQYYMHVDPAAMIYATTTFPVADGPHISNGTVLMPILFTKKWGKGNIFYLSIGHNYKDFDIPQVKTMMKRGLLWATKRGE